jgi:hypothetical protein
MVWACLSYLSPPGRPPRALDRMTRGPTGVRGTETSANSATRATVGPRVGSSRRCRRRWGTSPICLRRRPHASERAAPCPPLALARRASLRGPQGQNPGTSAVAPYLEGSSAARHRWAPKQLQRASRVPARLACPPRSQPERRDRPAGEKGPHPSRTFRFLHARRTPTGRAHGSRR